MNKYKNKGNIAGAIMRKERIKNNLSLEKLSDKLQLMGVVLYTNDLYLIEKQSRIIKDFELVAICEILRIRFEDIRKQF